MNNWDETFIEIANLMANHSTCKKLHVGAVIVKDKRIISCGYNGSPSGMKHCCDEFENIDITSSVGKVSHHIFSEKYEIHAEQNAICYASKYSIGLNGATLYTTTEPCSNCAKNIIASGIKRVVFEKPYKNNNGSSLLKEAGIIIEQWERNEEKNL